MNCKDCPKDFYYDCNQQPCNQAMAWEQLTEADRMENYKATGVNLQWKRLDGTRPPPPKTGRPKQ